MTILNTPGSYASAHFDLFYVVSDVKASDPITYPNYKYVADIYINGVMVNRLRKFPNPTNLFGVFNVGAIVRNYIQASFNPTPGSLQAMQAGSGYFNADVQIKFGEEYGLITAYNIISDSTKKVFNYYVRLLQGNSAPLSLYADKIPTNHLLSTNKLCTVRGLISTDYLFINYFATTTTPVNITVTGNSTYTTTITPVAALALFTLNVSPAILNTLQPGIITSALDYYTVTINADSFRVNMFCEAMYQVYPIHFLNQYGGFETVFFNKLSRQNIKTDKKSFGTMPYRVANDGTVNYKDASFVYYEADYNYSTTFNKSMTLNTDVLSDREYFWLEDLIESPLVYIQMNGYFYPVKITNTDYELRKQINETDLTNLTITLDLGRTFNSQFR